MASINRVILVGTLTKKSKTDKVLKGVVTTTSTYKDQTFTESNFITAFGEAAAALDIVPIGVDVCVEGSLETKKFEDKYYTSVLVRNVSVPNMGQNNE